MGITSLRRHGIHAPFSHDSTPSQARGEHLPYADTSPLAAKLARLGLKTYADLDAQRHTRFASMNFTPAEIETIDRMLSAWRARSAR